jgi:hypothetical protein
MRGGGRAVWPDWATFRHLGEFFIPNLQMRTQFALFLVKSSWLFYLNAFLKPMLLRKGFVFLAIRVPYLCTNCIHTLIDPTDRVRLHLSFLSPSLSWGSFLSNEPACCTSETIKARSFLVRKNIFVIFETVYFLKCNLNTFHLKTGLLVCMSSIFHLLRLYN